jgi:hypothetical protein
VRAMLLSDSLTGREVFRFRESGLRL